HSFQLRLAGFTPVGSHIGGADNPLPAVEAPIVLRVEEGQVETPPLRVDVEGTGELQQYGDAAGAVVGPQHRHRWVLLIGCAPGVVVGAQHEGRCAVTLPGQDVPYRRTHVLEC